MSNFYCSREELKRAVGVEGALRDPAVDRALEAASRHIDRLTRRRFIPETATYLLPWPRYQSTESWRLWLPFDLISVTTLQTKAQDSSPTTIASTDYFLEPQFHGPPYDRIEIDLSSTAAFEAGDTTQRSISVLGSWGYRADTRSVGTVASGLASSSAATSFVCSDASLIDVGDTLLIESEQLFVSNRDFAALNSILLNDTGVTASMANVTITVDASHGIAAGETVRLGSEQMYVEAVATNDLTVTRAYNGTVLAAHANNTAIHINRTLTVERGANGTTAATHANATAVSKYEPPFDVRQWCLAEAIAAYTQEGAAWGRVVGQGEGAREMGGRDLGALRERIVKNYRRVRMAAI